MVTSETRGIRSQQSSVKAKFPDVFAFLFEPARYKVAFGGRAGAKSWNFARALLIQGAQRPLRILCARETMKSISESVHRLLTDQIRLLGLESFYTVEKARIYGHNGTEITFAGLKHNVASIKSSEALDIVFVEEAQALSQESLRVLIPTIRKSHSELWFAFNPDFDDDPVYSMFVKNPPAGAIVRKVTYRDNPFFPEVLKQEMEYLRATDPDEFEHIWEGSVISLMKSAVYAAELRAVDRENRITRVPYDPARTVECFWDLGYSDLTAVWFAQAGPFEYRFIDYLENSGKTIQWYLSEMQSRGYVYGNDWLPWDVGLHATQMGSGKSIEELMRQAGRKVQILPKLSVADGINAARTIFPLCWFDAERCEEGIRALRHYRYGVNETLGTPTREPLHDRHSHGADSFRYASIGLRYEPPAPEPEYARPRYRGADAWMGA